jgi:hypothetical protein
MKREHLRNVDVAISQDRNVVKKEAETILQLKDLTIPTAHVEFKNKSDTNKNRVTGT